MTTANSSFNGVPLEFLCPMTKTIMRDPMMSRHGFSFERSAILAWLAAGHGICPVSGKPLRPSNLVSNSSLLSRIQKWTSSNVHLLLAFGESLADKQQDEEKRRIPAKHENDDDEDDTLVNNCMFFGIAKICPPPKDFLCPLTMQVMEDPLMSKDGVSFEKDAILNWLESFDFCPVTGKPLTPCNLVKNSNLQTRIVKWQQAENDMSTEEDAYFMKLVPSSSERNQSKAQNDSTMSPEENSYFPRQIPPPGSDQQNTFASFAA